MVMTQHYDYKPFVISDNTMALVVIFICQYCSSTLSFSNIPPSVHILPHKVARQKSSYCIPLCPYTFQLLERLCLQIHL